MLRFAAFSPGCFVNSLPHRFHPGLNDGRQLAQSVVAELLVFHVQRHGVTYILLLMFIQCMSHRWLSNILRYVDATATGKYNQPARNFHV